MTDDKPWDPELALKRVEETRLKMKPKVDEILADPYAAVAKFEAQAAEIARLTKELARVNDAYSASLWRDDR